MEHVDSVNSLPGGPFRVLPYYVGEDLFVVVNRGYVFDMADNRIVGVYYNDLALTNIYKGEVPESHRIPVLEDEQSLYIKITYGLSSTGYRSIDIDRNPVQDAELIVSEEVLDAEEATGERHILMAKFWSVDGVIKINQLLNSDINILAPGGNRKIRFPSDGSGGLIMLSDVNFFGAGNKIHNEVSHELVSVSNSQGSMSVSSRTPVDSSVILYRAQTST